MLYTFDSIVALLEKYKDGIIGWFQGGAQVDVVHVV